MRSWRGPQTLAAVKATVAQNASTDKDLIAAAGVVESRGGI